MLAYFKCFFFFSIFRQKENFQTKLSKSSAPMTTCHVTIHIVDPTIPILLHPSYREPFSLLSHLLKQPLDCCVNYYFRSFRHFFPLFSATFYYFCRRPSILYKSAILIRIDCSFIYLFFAVNFVSSARNI